MGIKYVFLKLFKFDKEKKEKKKKRDGKNKNHDIYYSIRLEVGFLMYLCIIVPVLLTLVKPLLNNIPTLSENWVLASKPRELKPNLGWNEC